MKTLIMLQGLPASGKSQWSKEFVKTNKDYVRVNRDDLRNMRGTYWLPNQEDMITEWERNCVKDAIGAGYGVVIDATNFNPKGIEYWMTLAKKHDYTFVTKFFDVPVIECIERDAVRTEGKVGANVIMGMFNKYLRNKVEFKPVVQDKSLPKAIICDLDGTLAIHNGRGPFELDKVDTDLPNTAVIDIIRKYMEEDYAIIFLSGREDKCKEKTADWLVTHAYPEHLDAADDQLLMRKTGDMRSDDIVKHEIFCNEILPKYYTEFVLDDRDKVVKMWRAIGLTCLQVNYGNF